MAEPTNTYAASGVDYSAVDPIKVLAQKNALATAGNLARSNAAEKTGSRGESAYVWEEGDVYRSLVIEGLGTKNLVADAVREFTGKSHYDSIAQDAIAMIVNDLIVVGALPQVINAYFAIGDPDWMRDEERARDLISGWADTCQKIGATWGGGETPMLKGIIEPRTIDIGGAAVGVINPKERLVLGDKLTEGDVIVLIESSGIHANGISFVRKLAEKEPDIYKAKLPDGRTFGEAILTPTHLYVDLVRKLMESKVDLHYMVNVTGHGWRKLMRATKPFNYVIHEVPPVPAEFELMRQKSNADLQEMYGNFNMGAGFAIYVTPSDVEKVCQIAKECGFESWAAGAVEKGNKELLITDPRAAGIRFAGETLEVR